MGSWHQLVISGNEKALRGFVAGFAAARDRQVDVAFGIDLGIEPSSLAARVRDLLTPGASHHAIYSPAATAAELAQALIARGHEVGLRVASTCEVHHASFSFEVETFSAQVASGIRAQLLDELPEGVALLDFRESETHRPEAEGAELYAPEHSYEYRASGTFRGSFPEVVTLYRRACTFDHVTATELSLETHGA